MDRGLQAFGVTNLREALRGQGQKLAQTAVLRQS
ncbi:MAG: hypothetical protein ACI9PY_001759 [Ascidiaceihabitans sp.]